MMVSGPAHARLWEFVTMDHQLFAYGTLLSASVQRAVIGRAVSGESAELVGFRKTTVQDGNEVFPNLVSQPGESVSGHLFEVTESELSRIDRYEGDLYARHRATLKDGREVWVYYS